jgi:short subunit dehydrogenase-like uncharacterized protein
MSPRVPPRRTIPVLVLGASGYTGRLVAAELARMGVPFAIAGRSATRLAELARSLALPVPQIVVDGLDLTHLTEPFRSARVVVSCAGPFSTLGEPVVQAAIAAGAHYLDITGEQEFVRRVTDYDAQAREAGVCLVPSMAFEVALSDMAARLAAARLDRADEIVVTYWMESVEASRGTRRSAIRVLAGPGFVLEGGTWADAASAPPSHTVVFPGDPCARTAYRAPGAEIVTIPRHTAAGRVRVYMGFAGLFGRIQGLVMPLAPRLLATSAGARLARILVDSGPEGAPAGSRQRHRFRIAVQARGAPGAADVFVQGVDPYGLTAIIAARAAAAMIADGFAASGCLPPALAFPPREFLDALAPAGVTVTGG